MKTHFWVRTSYTSVSDRAITNINIFNSFLTEPNMALSINSQKILVAKLCLADANGRPIRSAVCFIQGLAWLGTIVSLGVGASAMYQPERQMLVREVIKHGQGSDLGNKSRLGFHFCQPLRLRPRRL